VLCELCDPETQGVYVNEGGHEVPDMRDKEGLAGAVHGRSRVIWIKRKK
jgi:hypothetical protein